MEISPVVSLAVIAALAMSMPLFSPAPANACCGDEPRPNPQEQAFINDAKAVGVTSRGDDSAIGFVGTQICGEMYRGRTADAIVHEILDNNAAGNPIFTWVNQLNPVNAAQANNMTQFAYNDLCPQAVAVYPSPRAGKNPWQ